MLDDYLRQEIVDSASGETDRAVLGPLLVLCGNSRLCCANNCRTYMKWKWPNTAEAILDALRCSPKLENFSK
jgi:hypothetical protein